jgi:16S rRNA (guanine966-N2)-methyltransferase
MIRIVGGEYRHRTLNQPDLETTRCTKDSVKEGFFSSLGSAIDGSIFLDLFSGSGAIGIEAYSRGAKSVYLVEKDKRAQQVIKGNLSSLKITGINLFCGDYEDALTQFEKDGIQFNIVFLDPPYKMEMNKEFINHLQRCHILLPKHIIIMEKDNRIETSEFDEYNIKELKYGKTFVYILRSK